jgi:hypothetical protein
LYAHLIIPGKETGQSISIALFSERMSHVASTALRKAHPAPFSPESHQSIQVSQVVAGSATFAWMSNDSYA